MSEPQSNAARIREINDSIRYTMWSVFRLDSVLGEDADRASEGAEVESCSPSSPRAMSSSAACTTSAACAPTPT